MGKTLDSTYTDLCSTLLAAAKVGKSAYLHLDPVVWDVTDPKSEKNLVICTTESRCVIPLGSDSLPFIFSALKHSILAEGRTVLGWDLKSLFSWIKRKFTKVELPKFKYFDLKYLEKYAGTTLEKPNTFAEAEIRVNAVTKQDNWSDATKMWQKVMRPLAMSVVPALENNGVLNVERTSRVYPCYEIEAQDNGRMTCSNAFQWGVNVQTMGDDLRAKLAPKSLDEVFLYFDYSNMEVAVLQWLAQDDDLGEILNGDEDPYVAIFERIVGPHKNARKLAKKVFLPTIYGLSASGVTQKLGCQESLGNTIINRLNMQFAKSFRYVEQFQEDASKNGVVRDRFGRRRYITESPHLARNFSISSPATAICLERLVALHNLNVSPLLMSIHDGFVLSAASKDVSNVIAKVRDCLEAESTLAPGLKLKAHCNVGRSLADMTSL